jgi:hypothetical protein
MWWILIIVALLVAPEEFLLGYLFGAALRKRR